MNTMNKLLRKLSLGVVCLLMTAFICSCQSAQTGGTFEVGKNTFLLNGKPFVVKAAEVHYPRIPEPYWEQRILSCKALGMNTLCLYVFWNLHEQQPDKFDFSGNKDIAKCVRCFIGKKVLFKIIIWKLSPAESCRPH
jgi:beta-galactosidase